MGNSNEVLLDNKIYISTNSLEIVMKKKLESRNRTFPRNAYDAKFLASVMPQTIFYINIKYLCLNINIFSLKLAKRLNQIGNFFLI